MESSYVGQLSFGNFNQAFKPTRTDFDWLSRDNDEVDRYINDPLCGFDVSIQTWLDLLGGLKYNNRAEHQRRIPSVLPIYIIAGALDPVSNATKGLEKLIVAYRRAGLSKVSHRFFADGRHEIFNETNRDEVTEDLISWLAPLFPAP